MSQATLIKGEGIFPEPEVRHIRPHRRLLWKYLLVIILLWIAVLVVIISIFTFIFVGLDVITRVGTEIIDYFILICIGFSGAFILPIIIAIPFYIRSMEFIVHGNEVVVKKGLINKTVKHCPYRNIVNISTTAGPLDRLFGIGSVNIETAGKSGLGAEPEEKLEGLILYQEIRDYILRQIRTYQSSQEGRTISGEMPSDQKTLQRESLRILKEIRDLLKERIG